MAQRDFQRLVKLVARLFYAEGVPPPEEPLQEEDEEFYKPRKKAPAVTLHALHNVLHAPSGLPPNFGSCHRSCRLPKMC